MPIKLTFQRKDVTLLSETGRKALAEKLLSKQKVAVVPGIAFGSDYTIRFSYATSLDVINSGMDRFEEFCNQH